MKFKVGTQVVDCSEVFNFEQPNGIDVSNLQKIFTELEVTSNSIPEVIEKCLSIELHPWLKLALCLCNVRYTSVNQEVKNMTTSKYVEVLFFGPEAVMIKDWQNSLKNINTFLSDSPEKFEPLFSYFLNYIESMANSYFRIGSAWAKHDSICTALPPSSEDKWVAFSIFGKCIESGIPILESLDLAGESTNHPWMQMFFSIGNTQIRMGECLAEGIKGGISSFLWYRLQEYQAIYINEKDGKSDFKYFLPDFRSHFTYELNLLDAGESIGQLDNVSLKIAEHYKTPNSKPWSKDLSEIFSLLALYQESGLPILKSLILTQPIIQNIRLSMDLKEIIDETGNGSTLSEACAAIDSEFALPSVVAFLKCGERAGNLDKVLAYMAAQ